MAIDRTSVKRTYICIGFSYIFNGVIVICPIAKIVYLIFSPTIYLHDVFYI